MASVDDMPLKKKNLFLIKEFSQCIQVAFKIIKNLLDYLKSVNRNLFK